MKRLLVMRHAKSSWRDEDVSDHDRTLNDRGLRVAPAMGRWLCDQGIVPDLVISSSAKRAKMTTELVLERLEEAKGDSIPVEFDARLYLAAPSVWLQRVPSHCQGEECVLLVGHNPGHEGLVMELTDEYESMPTAAVAVIDIPIDEWSQLTSSPNGKLVHFWRPKEIGVD